VTTGTVKILSPIQTSCTPINHFQSVQYQSPKNCRLTARPTQYPQRGLHNTHSPQRGLGVQPLHYQNHLKVKTSQHNMDSVRTSCTLYTHSTHTLHTVHHQWHNSMATGTHTVDCTHSRRRQTESAATVCATHTIGVNPRLEFFGAAALRAQGLLGLGFLVVRFR